MPMFSFKVRIQIFLARKKEKKSLRNTILSMFLGATHVVNGKSIFFKNNMFAGNMNENTKFLLRRTVTDRLSEF